MVVLPLRRLNEHDQPVLFYAPEADSVVPQEVLGRVHGQWYYLGLFQYAKADIQNGWHVFRRYPQEACSSILSRLSPAHLGTGSGRAHQQIGHP